MKLSRSSALFLGGMISAVVIVVYGEGTAGFVSQKRTEAMNFNAPLELSAVGQRPLTVQDMQAARIAWQYIENNTQPNTGLVDSVKDFHSTTLWDQGSYVFALIAANKLGLLNEASFESRVGQLLASLSELPLFDGKLPNKVYNTQSLEMVDYGNVPVLHGIGWSALDIARLLLSLRVLEKNAPNFADRVHDLLSKWELASMAHSGDLWGSSNTNGNIEILQEGRLGYEQYAARSVAFWGLDALQAATANENLAWVKLLGVEVPSDLRGSRLFNAVTPIVSEPFLLHAFELGYDKETALLAERVYKVQEARFYQQGIPTMVSEDHLDQDPRFVYASVISDSKPWAVVTESGESFDNLRTISTKAVFGWDAIYETAYTKEMKQFVVDAAHPEHGWAAGLYETDQRLNEVYTLNTNAVILEALHFKAFGPFLSL